MVLQNVWKWIVNYCVELLYFWFNFEVRNKQFNLKWEVHCTVHWSIYVYVYVVKSTMPIHWANQAILKAKCPLLISMPCICSHNHVVVEWVIAFTKWGETSYNYVNVKWCAYNCLFVYKIILVWKDSCNNYNEKEAYIHVLVKQLVALHSFSSEGIEEDRCQGVYRLQLHICCA